MELVDPRGVVEQPTAQAAPRLAAQKPLTRIGFLSNEPEHPTGPHFPGYVRVLSRVLQERLGVDEFHLEIKPVLSRPAEDPMLDAFAGFDAVINGLAK